MIKQQIKFFYISLLIGISFLASAQNNSLMTIVQIDTLTEIENKDTNIYELIMSRIADDAKKISVSAVEQNTANYLALVNSNGAFNDIDYADKSRTSWAPLTHLDRLKIIASAYIMENSKYYADEDIYLVITDALTFWHEENPLSDNWWMQKVAVPQRLGMILIFLRFGEKALPAELENKILQRMATSGGDPAKTKSSLEAGANKVDIATHWIYRGCLLHDSVILSKGIEQAFYSVKITEGEGIQHDWSYHQHGPQLYIGGYGSVFINGIMNLAKHLYETPFALQENKLRILADFTINTYLPAIRGSTFLYNVSGRGLARYNGINNNSFVNTLEQFIKLDTIHKDIYLAAQQRIRREAPASMGVEPKHCYYWLSDYTLHQRPQYTFDVRISSKRIYRSEIVNRENLLGYFLTDGATCLVKKGDEYVNIFPVWDWSKIPGTTTPQLQPSQIPQPKPSKNYGSSQFAGGLTLDNYGITCFYLKNKKNKLISIEGKKAWFFFDKEIVCLGSDIQSKVKKVDIHTTVEQCLLSGEIAVIKENGEMDMLRTNNHINNYSKSELRAVYHNENGYYFPEGGDITVSALHKNGNWNCISPVNREASADLFTLYINHGQTPSNGKYCYYIIPDIQNIDNLNKYESEINVLANTSEIQAVLHPELSLLCIVFYKQGTLTATDNQQISIKSSHPCIVMVRDIYSATPVIAISDPTYKQKKMTLEVSLPGLESAKEVQYTMPVVPNNVGSTATFVIE